MRPFVSTALWSTTLKIQMGGKCDQDAPFKGCRKPCELDSDFTRHSTARADRPTTVSRGDERGREVLAGPSLDQSHPSSRSNASRRSMPHIRSISAATAAAAKPQTTTPGASTPESVLILSNQRTRARHASGLPR